MNGVVEIKKMAKINLVFPHQLFEKSPLLSCGKEFIVIEEWLFFNQYNFHKQKLAFHRASMLAYKDYLESNGCQVSYIDAQDQKSDIRVLIKDLASQDITPTVTYIDPTDCWLSKHLTEAAEEYSVRLTQLENPLFLNTKSENDSFFKPSKKKFFQTSFYKSERKKRNILIVGDNEPAGGKWTYDKENRKKYPAKKVPPPIHLPEENQYNKAAKKYVATNFFNNIGDCNQIYYPTTYEDARLWLSQFLEYRFHEFGTYEDAIVKEELFLNHSVLTPMLNVGLLTPQYIVTEALDYGLANDLPINSLEGFLRQIIGWREFIRGIYECKGTVQRTKNYWGFTRKIPKSFYDGTTGIEPIDQTIRKVLKTGYCHHIERLMILGNFMMLCEFDPDEVYRWFMELFIDAYDWVMVPNVYGMSQYADGGLMSTKPYISGSNYILKMSNYKKGEWQETWDGLFWRFMDLHRDFFLSNPRLGMLVRTFDKMDELKREKHILNGKNYLKKIEKQIS